jgi:carbon-monoxide dehydrogenase large subunit
MDKVSISLNINGHDQEMLVEPRKLLSDAIREDARLTGTHVGCEHGVCGACTVLIDGRPQRSCLTFAIQAQGKSIHTIESVENKTGGYTPLQQALHEEHGLQCGFCTPGIIVTFEAYLKDHPNPSDAEIRDVLSGNLCRCTGYQNIIKAIKKVVAVLPEVQTEIEAGDEYFTDFTSIGKRMPRREDHRLLRGQGRYLDDIEVPGALHACFLRSPHAHAKIVSIEMDEAKSMPGVEAVFTGKELVEWTTTMRMAPPIDGIKPVEMTALPIDKVRFHGDPVVCVVATDRYVAEDAIECIDVEYEPLDAVTDMFKAQDSQSPLVDDMLDSNLVSHQTFSTDGIDAIMEDAEHIVECRFAEHRQTQLPIETRGIIAQWDQGREHLTLHVGNQAPHPYRTVIAGWLELKESQVTVISPDVGGGFGQKIAVYREELTVAAIARHLKRPVRWREDRMENLLAACHAREDTVRTRAAVDGDGKLLGLTLEITEDFGAYCFYPANYLARVIAMIISGPYRLPQYAYDVKVVLTNKCGNGPMRAPMAITSWIMDGTIEAIAKHLSLDPVAVRRTNMLSERDLPYTMPSGEVLEDVNPLETLERGLEAFDYQAFRKHQNADRTQKVYRGIGICAVVESTTYGSKFYKSAGIPGSGHEAAWVKVEPSGVVRASVGLASTGQGYETAFAQTVAEGFGVHPDDVRIEIGNTDVAPYGMGSRGSRGATAGGGAAYLVGLKAQKKALTIAAKLLNIDTIDELSMRHGKVWHRNKGAWTETPLGLPDIARVAYFNPAELPEGMEPGFEIFKAYDPPPMTYSNSTHFCEVLVNIGTGQVNIERYLIVENCGTVINPLIVEGQQHGSVIMGISGTLFEHVIYDDTGQNLTGSLADYLIPTACEVPDIDIIQMNTPNKNTPAGIKGMAEGGVMGAIGAVSNAVSDALAPFNITIEEHPISPNSLRALLRKNHKGLLQ